MADGRNQKPLVPQSWKSYHLAGMQEETRLENESYDRPNKKFSFDSFLSLKIKLIVNNQPLRVGEGCLLEWLQRKKRLCALNMFSDNLCVFRCLAVHPWNSPGVRSGPWHRNRGTAAHSPELLVILPKRWLSVKCQAKVSLLFMVIFFPNGKEEEPPPPPWMALGIYLKHAFLITDQSLPSFTSQKKVHKQTNPSARA